MKNISLQLQYKWYIDAIQLSKERHSIGNIFLKQQYKSSINAYQQNKERH